MSDLKEGLDYYFESGLMVLTEHYLKKRGYCCENSCRHCPYSFEENKKVIKDPDSKKETQKCES